MRYGYISVLARRHKQSAIYHNVAPAGPHQFNISASGSDLYVMKVRTPSSGILEVLSSPYRLGFVNKKALLNEDAAAALKDEQGGAEKRPSACNCF